MSPPIALISEVATGLGVLAGAVMVMKEASMMGSGWAPRCPSCNGSGRVECICARWSDGDAGCRTCGGSVHKTCRSCGGTGTGRPISLRIPPPSRRRSNYN